MLTIAALSSLSLFASEIKGVEDLGSATSIEKKSDEYTDFVKGGVVINFFAQTCDANEQQEKKAEEHDEATK